MDNALQGLSDVVSRVDDILIATATVEGHVNLLKQVLERLHFHNLRVRKDKCKFLQPSIVYLGHTLSGAGLAPDPEKVKDLKDARPPTNVSEVRSFCGFVNYYASFLQGYSTVLQPLYHLTKKNFNGTRAARQHFRN